ncbi:YbjN domain-containing protein [Luedemannella helvata]|uniref:Sensory transduction regulator n=1 Tax=Luedemannella helvata TaxID=349315 RepID=A0ABP4X3Z3_9ACTN
MAWWPWRGTQRTRSRTGGAAGGVTELGALAERDLDAETAALLESSGALDTAVRRVELPQQRTPEPTAKPVTMARVAEALDRLEIRYLTDGDGSLLAMWERHALLFALEGPDDEILVMRGRPHATTPPDWVDRAYRVVNEWNHTRRFCKAYVGDPTERGQLPIYAEVQVPLLSGVHDQLLDELLDCAAAVTSAFVDWLHEDGALL